jgi:predicted lysophospholipase L1 biosynthesis ABC-type transport system permease subunit
VAAAYWPGQSAVGQQVLNRRGVGAAKHERIFTVIGVVGDAVLGAWDGRRDPIIYAPYAALNFSGEPVAFVRTTGRAGILEQVIAAAEQDAPQVTATRAAAASTMLADTIRPRRLQSWLFGSFAVAALVIVGAGVLGLVAMTTARRTREVGIRMALGATRPAVVQLIVREQLAGVAAGVLLGAIAAYWAVAAVKSYLYEITPYDMRVWAIAIAVIVTVSLAGVLVPARRASGIDPVTALRVDG